MNLVVVESPTKARTLNNFLGKNYKVESSYGHIRDLPKSKLGIDIENNFEPQYIIPVKARKRVNQLKKEAEKVDAVILASVDYSEPILVCGSDNIIRQWEVGKFIDEILEKGIRPDLFKVPVFDFKNRKISFKSIKGVSRHPIKEKLLEVALSYGRKLKITASHSVFTIDKNNQIKTVLGEKLKVNDKLLIPLRLPLIKTKLKETDLLKEIYDNYEFRQKVFIKSDFVSEYRRKNVLSPKNGDIPQFQPRLILSEDFRCFIRNKRESLGLSQKLLANRIGCAQSNLSEWETNNGNPTVAIGEKYLNILGFDLKKMLKTSKAVIAPSSIEIAIRNALENQWRDSRKSKTRTWQPLSWFSWGEIEKNFNNDRTIEISRNNHCHRMPRFVPVNEDLMLFLGYFIAEGSFVNSRYPRFSFGKKTLGGEKNNIEAIKEISKRLFNLIPSDFEDKTTNNVVLNSSLVGFLLKEVLGVYGNAKNKEVPWIVFNVSPNLQLSFLKGFFLGDGSITKGNIVFNTISPKLAYGIRFLLLQQKILTSHSLAISKKPNRRPLHQIIICGKERLIRTKLIWEKHYKSEISKKYLLKKNNIKRRWSLISNQKEDLGLLEIKSLKEIKPTSQFVYDFSVEGENFICGDGGVCAHNTDEDREGEAIAFHLVQVLGLNEKPTQKIQRIVFHEITKSAINEALENPRDIDMNLVDAQQARRVLDRLVGYKLSPFLWEKIMKRLSAGRVQSVALRLIVEREGEIRNFKPEEYYTISAILQKLKILNTIEANLFKINNEVIPKLGIKTREEAEKIVKDLEKCDYKVSKIERKEIKKNPLPPFTTSTLQQEASKRLRFSAKQTMRLAQSLYESGFITYMRTDSLNLSKESVRQAAGWIEKNLGKKYAIQAPRFFKTQSRLAQEAHEAIRPTNVNLTTEKLKTENFQEKNLYDLIWRRFIASQLPQARFDSTVIEIEARNSKSEILNPKQIPNSKSQNSKIYFLKASGSMMKFDGLLKIWPIRFEEKELPLFKENEELKLIKITSAQHFTEPAPRYNEASLIKTLEKYGIGRPSTYAPIISVIQERNYVYKNEERRFQTTEIGELVNKILVEHFPEIVDVQFTAQMEEELDEIAQGKEKWQKVIGKFYQPFAENLKKKYQEVEKQKPIEEKTEEICEKCGKPMVIKYGRFGKFVACSGFPDCKNTKSLNKQGEAMGKSLGSCPKCQTGKVIMKRTRRHRFFYGCSRYPDCDFASWRNPFENKN